MKLKSRSHQFFEGVLVHILFHHFVFITHQSSVAVGLFSETMASIFSNKAIVSLHTSYYCLRVLLFSAKHFLTFKSVIALSHFHLAHESQLSLHKEKILSQKFYFTEIFFYLSVAWIVKLQVSNCTVAPFPWITPFPNPGRTRCID